MDSDEIDTGIWQISRPKFRNVSEFFDHFTNQMQSRPNPHDLSTICEDAVQFARLYIEMDERGEWFESKKDVTAKGHNRAEALKQIHERREHMLRIARRMLHQVSWLKKALTDGEAKRAIVLGFWLGSNYEKLRILPHERNSAAAKRSRAGAKKIAELHAKKARDSRPDFQQLVAEQIDLQRRSRNKPVVSSAIAVVAANNGVSVDTVRRNVKNIWTARPRKKK